MPITQDCRNSDLPAPVVPPTRACGPSFFRSRYRGSMPLEPTRARRVPLSFRLATALACTELFSVQRSATAWGLSRKSLPISVA
ncbi:hypothetical protein D3C85_1576910 [compost metagenome]